MLIALVGIIAGASLYCSAVKVEHNKGGYMSWYTEWCESKSREIPEKKCGCGKSHHMIPEDAKEGEWGYFWNCECNSTLFWPNEKTRKEIDDAKKKAAA